MKEITTRKPTSKGAAGKVLRVWESGNVESDMVDPQRAAQWIEDGIAASVKGAEVPKKPAARTKAPKAPRKRGK